MVNKNDEIQSAIITIQVKTGCLNLPRLLDFFSLRNSTKINLTQFDPQKLSLPANIIAMASFSFSKWLHQGPINIHCKNHTSPIHIKGDIRDGKL